MRQKKTDEGVAVSAKNEGTMVDLLNTEMQQLQDSMLINDLTELAKSNPGSIYEKLLDLLNRRQEKIVKTYYFLSQSQGRELDYVQRNAKLAEENTILTNKLDRLSDRYTLYKDAHESIKSKAATLIKENKELKTKLAASSNEGAKQIAFAIESNLAYYGDKDTFSKEYILSLISDILKERNCKE